MRRFRFFRIFRCLFLNFRGAANTYMKTKSLSFLTSVLVFVLMVTGNAQDTKHLLWKLGEKNSSASEFALAPSGFRRFVEHDFGYEDKYFLIGHSRESKDFSYVLPGPVDTWGGTWSTAGWRINQVNILFGVDQTPGKGNYEFVISLLDYAKTFLPKIKVTINDRDTTIQLTADGFGVFRQQRPRLTEPLVDSLSLTGDLSTATPKSISIPIKANQMCKGGNQISITVIEGSWIMFDQVCFTGPEGIKISSPEKAFLRKVMPADYWLELNGNFVQPLLVDVEHILGSPQLTVLLDGESIFTEKVEQGRYIFEAPMPAVSSTKESVYKILLDGQILEEGTIIRSGQPLGTLADYVDTRMGTDHSRWMIAPGPWMPFSMVKVSPDNQNSGWQAGYQSSFESIGTFSHIHEWTMAGLGVFPANGKLQTAIGDELYPDSGYRSRIDKSSEKAPIGYYKVNLTDYDIKAEFTATTRGSFGRFTYPEDRDSSRVLIDFHIPAEYDYHLKEISFKKINNYRIEGISHQFSQQVWSRDADQEYQLHFIIEFDQPIKDMGFWVDEEVQFGESLKQEDCRNAGMIVHFNTKQNPVVQMRTGISLVSIANAADNLRNEIVQPHGWNFEAVRQQQIDTWNELLNRVQVSSSNRLEKQRFYNAMYRSICSRNTWSDTNGEWRGTDGKVHKLTSVDDVALGCDAFWNTFWNLNQLWNLVTPEWSKRWVNAQLAMYDAYGLLAKGPAGMNYVPVMVAEHEIPLIVSAYQMGIRGFDARKALEAAIKMQYTAGRKIHQGFAGNRDLESYLKYQYVPSDLGRFSNSMEYSFDDWTVGQLAKALGDSVNYRTFNDRGYWWKNTIDPDGFSHMKLSNGEWVPDFDPFKSGANHHYVEGNAWQLTFFVPQDVPALVDLIGKQRFIDRLEWGFEASEPWRYNGMNDQYWDYPVMQGNQQSMHFAFLFNWAGKPWSTQKWSRSIIDRYYGFGTGNAYLGDEDQGQMSAWLVMASLGLFQTDGGCSVNPMYEIGSPVFEKAEIDLGGKFGRGDKFVIRANGASKANIYIQSARLNGKTLNSFRFPASELLKGGELILEMGPEPNTAWGIE
jgi:predicted alpha-1,2-mannosidase